MSHPISEDCSSGLHDYCTPCACECHLKDEFHTMDELYDHRLALNVALFNIWAYQIADLVRHGVDVNKLVVKSKLHFDGTMFDGYFVVAASTEKGQISYHYKLEHWDKFKVPEVERIQWEYDGHTSKDVIQRLLAIYDYPNPFI